MSTRSYRGYIFSRPIDGAVIPQRVQNLVIRDYAHRRELQCHLSATEYAMENCTMILKGVIEEFDDLAGIIFYSVWQLPEERESRQALYRQCLQSKKQLHFALEQMVLVSEQDALMLEALWLARDVCARNVTASHVGRAASKAE